MMNKYEIVGEFINELQLILENNICNLDSKVMGDIRVDAHEALCKILEKHDLLED